MASTTILLRQKGVITLPADLRQKYGLSEGDAFTLIDMGEGTFVLAPYASRVDQLADEIAQAMKEDGVTLDDLLAALDEERERYYQEHYVQT